MGEQGKSFSQQCERLKLLSEMSSEQQVVLAQQQVNLSHDLRDMQQRQFVLEQACADIGASVKQLGASVQQIVGILDSAHQRRVARRLQGQFELTAIAPGAREAIPDGELLG